MDNLAMDSIRAIQEGMSYGNWKLKHPYTEEENLPLIEGFEENGKKPRKKREPVIHHCPICGKEIPVIAGKRTRKYCSVECQHEARRRRERKSWKNTEAIRKCRECGADFETHGNGRKIYCCNACAQRAANRKSLERARAKKVRAQMLGKQPIDFK